MSKAPGVCVSNWEVCPSLADKKLNYTFVREMVEITGNTCHGDRKGVLVEGHNDYVGARNTNATKCHPFVEACDRWKCQLHRKGMEEGRSLLMPRQ